MLTCRLPGMTDRSPIRIVADTRLRLPLTSRLVATAKDVPLWLVTLDTIDPARLNPYIDAGVEIVAVADDGEGRPDLRQTARELATRGLTRVLIEGGGRLTAAFLSRGLVDRLVWFRAPSLIGGDGMTAAAAFGIDALSDAPRFLLDERRQLEGDVVETYDRAD
jgi:diaminohydroxyphosphoribosylaminopyrimidine deaminase/5-amino-6-(5-phosphoribosylamino)uracil reductase